MRKILYLLAIVLVVSLIGCEDKSSVNFVLTSEEQAWLDDHPVIYYATDPEFAPYEFYNENKEHEGLVTDYLNYLEDLLKVDIVLKDTDSWTQALNMGKNNEVNFLFMTKTEERSKFFTFTKPFIFSPNVLMINEEFVTSVDLDNIEDYSIGVLKDYSNKDYFRLLYPSAPTIDYNTIIEGMLDLAAGKIDVFLADLGQTSYYVNKYGITQLSIYDSIAYEFQFSFAVNNEYAPLVPILDKAIASMTEEEHQAIKEQWFQSEYKNWLNRRQTTIIYIAAIIVFIVAALLVLLTIIMRRIIKSKTKELEAINAVLEDRVFERTKELLNVNEELEASYEELVSTQEKLITSEKYASLGKIVASVAHELNTPLGTSITSLSYGQKKLNYLEDQYENKSLSKQCFEDSTMKLSESFEMISSNLSYIASVVERFKRLEATLISNRVEAINLKSCINASLQVLTTRNLIPEGYNIILSIDDNIQIQADQLWMDEIVFNLVQNAITHGKLEKDNIYISAFEDKDITLIFEDHGVGISKTEEEKIYEPFYKKHHEEHHIGLGLSIVYNIVVNSLFGKIEIDSKPNEFTKFIINIPKVKQPE